MPKQLQRLSPGVYRGAGGGLVNSAGRALPGQAQAKGRGFQARPPVMSNRMGRVPMASPMGQQVGQAVNAGQQPPGMNQQQLPGGGGAAPQPEQQAPSMANPYLNGPRPTGPFQGGPNTSNWWQPSLQAAMARQQGKMVGAPRAPMSKGGFGEIVPQQTNIGPIGVNPGQTQPPPTDPRWKFMQGSMRPGNI